jgi:hypothetical protein
MRTTKSLQDMQRSSSPLLQINTSKVATVAICAGRLGWRKSDGVGKVMIAFYQIVVMPK